MINRKMSIKWNSKINGIYAWINEINGKMYIGQSNNLYKRIYCEMNNFINSKQQNLIKLEHAIKKYGIDNFRVVKLLECPKEYSNKIEKLLIEYYDTKNNGYNCTYGGDGNLGHIVTQKQIQKQKEMMRKYWTDERKKQHTEKMKLWANDPIRKQHLIDVGKSWVNDPEIVKKHKENTNKSLTKERIEKQRRSILEKFRNCGNKKSVCFTIISPAEEKINFNYFDGGISGFCKKYKLSYTDILKVIKGKKMQHQGWHLGGINPEEHGFIMYELLDYNGKNYKFHSIKQFCKERGLKYGAIKQVLRGKIKHHKYFHLKSISIEKCINNYNRKYTNIIFKDCGGNDRNVINPRKFCNDNGFSFKYLNKFLRLKNVGDYFHGLRLISK